MSKAESVVSRGTKQIGQRLLPWIFLFFSWLFGKLPQVRVF